MKIEIDISDEKLQNLRQTAKTEIGKVCKAYVEEVLDEASRIEESRRTATAAALYQSNKLTTDQICSTLGIKSKTTLYRYLRHEGIEINGWTNSPKIKGKIMADRKGIRKK